MASIVRKLSLFSLLYLFTLLSYGADLAAPMPPTSPATANDAYLSACLATAKEIHEVAQQSSGKLVEGPRYYWEDATQLEKQFGAGTPVQSEKGDGYFWKCSPNQSATIYYLMSNTAATRGMLLHASVYCDDENCYMSETTRYGSYLKGVVVSRPRNK